MDEAADRGDQAQEAQPAAPARSAVVRFLYRMLGLAMVGLAIAGVFLPLLPTTPFLIVAAWAFARSSPRLEAWLRNHRQLGPFLSAWEERGAIPRWAKALAVAGIASGWGVLVWRGAPLWALAGSAALLLMVLAWILTRPSA